MANTDTTPNTTTNPAAPAADPNPPTPPAPAAEKPAEKITMESVKNAGIDMLRGFADIVVNAVDKTLDVLPEVLSIGTGVVLSMFTSIPWFGVIAWAVVPLLFGHVVCETIKKGFHWCVDTVKEWWNRPATAKAAA